jgi:glutamate N-acetyltransferase/amino-acid N-acetyltransferase
MQTWTEIAGGVTAPQGFLAAGVAAGIKASGMDMALLVSAVPAVVAGTFTQNRIQAAPVKLCRERLSGRQARAVIINSGNANACTGEPGMVDAIRMASRTAKRLEADPAQVFVCSTGTIGKPLPMDRVEAGIEAVVAALTEDGGDTAAKAIMTTDTVDKQVAATCEMDGKTVTIGGMAKGAGMIEPNMATMLGFLTTDATVPADALQACLSAAVGSSFNRITVDGDQSTNDTVLMFANGMAGTGLIMPDHPQWSVFCDAVGYVCTTLAKMIVKDGEGATRFVTITVNGAVTRDDAFAAARAVANSLLVKTSWYGGDPNWGRVIDAVGYSGAELTESSIDIRYNDVWAVKGGRAAESSLADLEAVLQEKTFEIVIDLNLGSGTDTVYTCDCSEEYVRINSEYMT